ncbi:MAG: hypothetical protein FJ279_17745 [Planctomycetes bacterium]|nr:hypothetical protein [Planctomycetota bacterium]MBM4078176.1 hypothetical protein [Planctomycetota bacterium]
MRFGIVRKDVTPPFPTSMAGYGARRDYFDGVNDPITFTAVVLEEGGRRAMLGAADLCNFPDDESTPRLLDQLAAVIGCPRDNILLNASHTHGGPKLTGHSAYSRRRYDMRAAARYRDWLFEQVMAAAREAIGSLQDGTLWYGEGKTKLPMNRRPDRNGQVPNAPNPGGPVDDRMRLLVFRNAAGEVAAVGMRVSAHPVATGAQHLLTADYPGAWRAEFSRAFGPDVTPFFLQGAGADARPRHAADGDRWRALKHAELPAVGQELLAEMLRILTGQGLKEIRNLTLQGKMQPIAAPCEKRYVTREQFQELLKKGGGYAEYAEEALEFLDAGKPVADHGTFHVQTLWLNRDLALIGLDAEPLCGLGRFVEAAAAPAEGVLLGYTNGCVAYTPDTAELKRGGYEADSYLYECWTGPLLPGLEKLMAEAVMRNP